MKPQFECRECLIRLVVQAACLATNDKILRDEAVSAGQSVVDFLIEHNISPANIASIFHRKIQKITGNPDPFSVFKQKEVEQARELFEVLKEEAGTDLESLIKFSVKGNALDFFRTREEILRDFHSEITFAVNHMDSLEKFLKPGAKLLLLADNAGECFFDLPLVRFLSGMGMDVGYVIKGYPSQNDITSKELEFSGLRDAFPKVLDNGSDNVGLYLANSSHAFRKAFYEADVIIAKGMGHYETMLDNTDSRLFFLFKAKCRPVAAEIGIPYESYALKNACCF